MIREDPTVQTTVSGSSPKDHSACHGCGINAPLDTASDLFELVCMVLLGQSEGRGHCLDVHRLTQAALTDPMQCARVRFRTVMRGDRGTGKNNLEFSQTPPIGPEKKHMGHMGTGPSKGLFVWL